MSLGSRFWPAIVLAALASHSAQAADWVSHQAGDGRIIQMPVPGQPISVRRYRVQTSDRPYVHLKRSLRPSEINYFVDEVGRGVLSGNIRQQLNFYALCRREPGELVCIELYYPAGVHGDYVETIADIARSFENEGRP
ncbi:hypothetical protein ABIB57_004309 [Devosia sp. UYZn731]|uniref:hypothetical protein n=1 Tax=Devosia sp. UYZn731 TaxID=3156345 RepID=UPI003393A590